MTPPYFGFSPDDLQQMKSELLIERIEYHETLDSTNDRAMAIIRETSAELPALILAANQTAGRGRATNQWFSGPGALTFSLTFEPPTALPTDRLPMVSLVVGLAVCETLTHFLPDPNVIGLKWPNDVLLDGGKVCGILVEAISTPSRRLVIGVGMNVNNDLTSVDVGGHREPTSLAGVSGKQFGLADVLIQLLANLDEQIGLLTGVNDTWHNACQRYCVLTGRTVHIDAGDQQITGLCRGIGPDGALLIEAAGIVQSVYSGTVRNMNQSRT